MSLGFGRGLFAIACLVAVSGAVRVAAQTPPASPPPTTPAPPAATAPAQPAEAVALPKVEPSQEAVERARTAYARGQEAFAAGDFNSALASFQEAFANVANPIVLVSIGESAAKLSRVETALAAYDAYLRARPDAPDREEVAQKRAALADAQVPARLVITSVPAGADVILDGQLVGRTTPVVLEARPGAHNVSLVLTGYDTERLSVELTASSTAERAVTLRPSPAPPVAQAPQPPVVPPPPVLTPEPPRAAIIVTAGLGAAGVIAGSVLGIFALKERSDYNTNPSEAGADRGERLALFSDVGFGIGAMSLITTAVLLFTHDPPRSAEERESARFELTPSFTPQSASASAKVRF
jgi:tetratricopeptide (TPR) repeat protein